MQRLIDDLLELSRIENNLQKAPETQCTDVSEIAQEALEHLSPMAQERQIAFSSELTPELTIRADPDRIVQLFTNLIQNAVKYNRPGGSVTVSTQAARGMAVIKVEDTASASHRKACRVSSSGSIAWIRAVPGNWAAPDSASRLSSISCSSTAATSAWIAWWRRARCSRYGFRWRMNCNWLHKRTRRRRMQRCIRPAGFSVTQSFL